MTQLPPLPSGPAAAWAAVDRANPVIELPEPPAAGSAYTLRIDIVDAKPPIWRRLVLRSDVTLDVLHRVLQAAFGWEDYHLHRFSSGDPYLSPYFTTPGDVEEGETGTPEAEARLDQVLTEVGARLELRVRLRRRLDPPPPARVRGAVARGRDAHGLVRRRSPGRTAGGLRRDRAVQRPGGLGAQRFPRHRAPGNAGDLVEWIPEGFDPDHFSVPETDTAIEVVFLGDAATIAQAAGAHPALVDLLRPLPSAASDLAARWLLAASLDRVEPVDAVAARAVTRPWRVLLRHVGEGVTLSKAGYLPPAVVQAVYDELELGREWIGKGNREDLTPPVLQLREQVQALGLLRKARGTLAPTAAARRLADDPVALIESRRRPPAPRPTGPRAAGGVAHAAGDRRRRG